MKNIRFFLFLFLFLASPYCHAQKTALQWSTYFGGDTATYGGGISTDAYGNVYISGQTYRDSGIATKGAYQTWGDSTNGTAFLAKFSSSGSLLWATYFGDSDEAEEVNVDKFGNIYITGYTNSKTGIATSGAFQTSLKGSGNAFLAKFSTYGSLMWATYFGGNKDDGTYGIGTDSFGNILICGWTYSDSGIATKGAYQATYGGGGDAFLAKLNPSGSLLWATYLGGNKEDVGWWISIDSVNDIYVSGNTQSVSGIATKGAYQTMCDSINSSAFLAKFSSLGNLLWATCFGKKTDPDISAATDIFNNIYIAGGTTSATDIATSSAYKSSFDGGNGYGEVFLAKFNSSGTLFWATYYGGGAGDDGDGLVATDKYGNVFLAGSTNGTSDIATSGAYQTSNGGDMMLF